MTIWNEENLQALATAEAGKRKALATVRDKEDIAQMVDWANARSNDWEIDYLTGGARTVHTIIRIQQVPGLETIVRCSRFPRIPPGATGRMGWVRLVEGGKTVEFSSLIHWWMLWQPLSRGDTFLAVSQGILKEDSPNVFTAGEQLDLWVKSGKSIPLHGPRTRADAEKSDAFLSKHFSERLHNLNQAQA